MKKNIIILCFIFCLCSLLVLTACDQFMVANSPKSNSGVKQAKVTVTTASNGRTVEQNNVIERLKMENQPGSIKHLYVISAYSGQVLIYSTVKGKVTSSGKRLSPYSVATNSGTGTTSMHHGVPVNIGDRNYYTSEILQDDGTYGSSIDYLYWFDSKGIYHQHYVTGGQILHISEQPIQVPSIVLNMELTSKTEVKE